MFSYRHAFHAGNHADVLKHTTLLAILRHLKLKDTALTVFDTHAGAGLYRLDGDYANTTREASQGYLRLVEQISSIHPSPALQDYMDVVASFNSGGSHKVYPGSPFLIQHLLRDRDKLKLFELHPTDIKTLTAHIDQLDVGRQVAVLCEDGFEGIRKFLPPPTCRALVLCDPSYEIKSDYDRVTNMVTDALTRFATGIYAVWYPIIPRPEAHQLPRKLKTLCNKTGKPWLNATLTVKSSKFITDDAGDIIRPGLPASGIFVIHPPYTLKATLQDTLKQVAQVLSNHRSDGYTVETGGNR
jgi:23S rRNA (adenine2030-N6)-methyltransferase